MTLEVLRDGDPSQVGPYTLLARLGEGGMGVVYLARDPAGTRVAVKLLHARMDAHPDFRRRFAREVAAAQRVARFCTAPVLDADVQGRLAYLVTEYVEGPSLKQHVTTHGPLRGSALDGLAASMAMALRAIHGAGVVHRDLKPSNVLLSQVGPKVIDFGVAWLADSDLSSTVLGTPAYMSPEQISGGAVGPASDIFSWGCTVAFAAAGTPPFGSGTIPTLLLRIVQDPPTLTGLPRPLHDLVLSTLNKNPTARPTAQDLMDHLSAGTAGGTGAIVLPPARGSAPTDSTPTSPGTPAGGDRTPDGTGTRGTTGTPGAGLSGENATNASPAGAGVASAGVASAGVASAGVASAGVAGAGVAGAGVAGAGVAGAGVAGAGVAGAGVAGAGVAGAGVAGAGVASPSDASTAGVAGAGDASTAGASAHIAGTSDATTASAGIPGARGTAGAPGAGSAGTGVGAKGAGTGSAGTGSAGTGSAGLGSAGLGSAGSGGADDANARPASAPPSAGAARGGTAEPGATRAATTPPHGTSPTAAEDPAGGSGAGPNPWGPDGASVSTSTDGASTASAGAAGASGGTEGAGLASAGSGGADGASTAGAAGNRRKVLSATAALLVAVAGVSVALALRGDGKTSAAGTSKTPPPTATTTTTTTTTTHPTRENPLRSKDPITFYAPEEPAAAKQAALWKDDRPQDAELMRKLALVPHAVRLAQPEVRSKVEATITAAEQAGGVPVFLVNYMPDAECRPTTTDAMRTYQEWLAGVARQIGPAKAVVILEPGSLVKMPGTDQCPGLQGSQDQRYQDLRQAVRTLKANPRTAVYLDGSQDHWPGTEIMAERLIKAGIDRTDGFFLNTAAYQSTANSVEYGKALSACIAVRLKTGGTTCPKDTTVDPATMPHFVVDTSRNGQGSWSPKKHYADPQTWCNPPGRGVGDRPTTETGEELVDAYLWIARAGTSSGRCRRGTDGEKDPERGVVSPESGEWWADLALERAKNANPPLR